MFKEETIKEIRDEFDRWHEEALKKAEKAPDWQDEVITESGIPIKLIYTPEDIEDFDYSRDLNFPGQYPFTRGPYHTMHRGRKWTMRALSGLGSPEAERERLLYLQEAGETGLNVILDLPTFRGLDPDNPLCEGEVGRAGVNISSYQDFKRMFEGIDLSKVSFSLVAGAAGAVLTAMYWLLCKERGYDMSRLEGSTQNDLLKDQEVVGCACSLGVRGSVKVSLDLIEFMTANLPRWNTVTFNGHAMRDNGVNAVQEIAWCMANAKLYAQELVKRGLHIDAFVPRFAFFFGVDENFFEEIAKFRAARRIWARLMQEEFNTTNPRSCALRMAVQSTGRIFTAQQPYINLMRGAFQSLAAVLGGCQSLNTDTLDEALGIPQPIASELALRTQQIVAYETRVTDTIDPLAGSYYVESLTKAIEGRVHEYMEKLDALGGPLEALEKGFFEKEWTEASLKYTNDIMDGKKTRIGVNKFVKADEDDHEFHPFRVPPHYEEIQADRVRKLRQERDNAEYEATLDKIRGLARREENVIPGIAEALEADATIGEISDVLREFYGAYQPHSVR